MDIEKLPDDMKSYILKVASNSDYVTTKALKLTSKKFNSLILGKIKVIPEEYFSLNHPSFMKAYNDALWQYKTDKSIDEIGNNSDIIKKFAKYNKIKWFVMYLNNDTDTIVERLLNQTNLNKIDFENITISNTLIHADASRVSEEIRSKIPEDNITSYIKDVVIYDTLISMYFKLINASDAITQNIYESGLPYINDLRSLFQHKSYLYDNNTHDRNKNIFIAFELSKLQINIWIGMHSVNIFKYDEMFEALEYVMYYQEKGIIDYIPIAETYTRLYYHYIYIYFKLYISHDNDENDDRIDEDIALIMRKTDLLYESGKSRGEFLDHPEINDHANYCAITGNNKDKLFQKYMALILSDKTKHLLQQNISLIV
jgi:hypothetical protein